jgi:hypothetical protein
MSDKYFTSPQRFEFLKQSREQSFKDGHLTKEQYEEWIKYIEQCCHFDGVPDIEDIPSLEQDLRYSETISNKCKSSDIYSQNLYAALCNNEFQKDDKIWSCSWRSAGGIVANLREEGDYINWYCSGQEGVVTDEIRKDIEDFGWTIIEHENESL